MIAAKPIVQCGQCLLVKAAGEIALKSPPVRCFFTKKLVRNIRFALKRNSINCGKIIKGGGRLYLFPSNLKKAQRVLLLAPGVHAVAVADYCGSADFASLEMETLKFSHGYLRKGDSFALDVSVANNRNFSSKDLEIRLGAAVQREIPGLKVKLKAPEKEINIEVCKDSFFIYSGQLLGLGGLPIGVEGNVALLFAGKKQDLLAAFLMMRRGCNVFPVAKKPGKKLENSLKKLVPLNSFRKFVLAPEKELPSLVKVRNIKAIVTGESKADSKSLKEYAEFDAGQQLVVLRPLLLYPPELRKKAERLLH